MLKKFLQVLNKKGQSILYFAGLAPLVFAFGCAGIDIGWYFLNVSRLQNAADAAAVAGSKELIKRDNSLSDYRFTHLYDKPDTYEENTKRTTDEGDPIAKQYANNNLGTNSNIGEETVTDSWSQNEVSFTSKLYGPNNPDEIFYYVELKEEVKHAFGFLTNQNFKKMGINISDTIPITVSAAAKIKRFENDAYADDDAHRPSLAEQMEALRDGEDAVEGKRARKAAVYTYFEVMQQEYRDESAANKAAMQKEIQQALASGVDETTATAEALERWINKLAADYIKRGVDESTARTRAEKDLTGDRSLSKAMERSVEASGNWWLEDLTRFRTENLSLNGLGGTNWKERQYDFDDLFINFRADINYNFKTDWDIGYTIPEKATFQGYCKKWDINGNKITYTGNLPYTPDKEYRIISIIGIEPRNNKYPYKTRSNREAPDVLFARIESEPIKWLPGYNKGHIAWSSVHQIIINVNCSNFDEVNDRPIVFYYDGPGKLDNDSPIRDSQPVILNLNADFRGVLYAPNSPVVVCGNNHKFEGFVVAKEFLTLKKDADFENEGYVKAIRQDNLTATNKYLRNTNKIYIMEKEIKTLAEGEELPENSIAVKYNNETNHYIDRDAEFYEKLTTFKVDSGYNQNFAPFFVNNKADNENHIPSGNVQTKDSINATHTGESKARKNEEADNRFDKSDFNLKSSVYNEFNLLDFANYTYLNDPGDLDNMFVYTRAQQIR